MEGIVFAYPGFFWLFLLFPFMLGWYFFRNLKARAGLRFSSLEGLEGAGRSARQMLRHLPFALRLIGLAAMVVALARPQSTNSWQNVTTEGIDIVLALDISGSMLAEDFKPNRLEASKAKATEFINARPNDRIGLVVYSGESFTQCPLTTDHSMLINLLNNIENGMIEDGTAIGLGLANAVNRLKESKAKSRVVILLTDGVNNKGEIAPITAAEIASSFGIRVYTIGVGTQGTAPYPFKTAFGTQYQNVPVEIDEKLLNDMASMTGGTYFRATGNQRLSAIYKEIDRLEKTRIEVREFSRKNEMYLPVALFALGILLIEILLRNTIFRSIP